MVVRRRRRRLVLLLGVGALVTLRQRQLARNEATFRRR
jgi:hypothetical protein